MQITFDQATQLTGLDAASDVAARVDQVASYTVQPGGSVNRPDHTLTYPAGVIRRDAQVTIQPGASAGNYAVTNLTPTLASLQGNSLIAAAQGTGAIAIDSPHGRKTLPYAVHAPLAEAAPSSVPLASTFAAHVLANIRGLYAGKPATDATLKRWTALTPGLTAATTTGTRNASWVLAGVDMSWQSVCQSDGATSWEVFGCALLTPRHVLCANHTGLPSRIIFQRPDGTFTEALTVSNLQVPSTVQGAAKPGMTDSKIYYLDRAVTGITPVLVLPPLAPYTPSLYPSAIQPVADSNFLTCIEILINGFGPYSAGRKAVAACARRLGATVDAIEYFAAPAMALGPLLNEQLDPLLSAYSVMRTGGDSSSMVLCPVVQQGVLRAALLSCVFGGADPCLPDMHAQMQTVMRSLAAAQGDNFPYTLSVADLSAFTQFT